jgi:hypothetical protein
MQSSEVYVRLRNTSINLKSKADQLDQNPICSKGCRWSDDGPDRTNFIPYMYCIGEREALHSAVPLASFQLKQRTSE